ncbi:MAG TPA: type III pantothenate kinase [Planctomycetota bacterium]|nr:type III pantothenate kinase [Planctomycetota bacterium]
MLALDVGNGSIKYGVFEGGRVGARGRVPLGADPARLPSGDPAAAVSVNPPALAALRRVRKILVVGEDLPVPLPVEYDPPEACGLDRVLGAAGALHLVPGAPGVCLLDAGTCLTATVALRGRGVIGGAILPGPDLMARALAEGTAALPLVDPAPPQPGIGRSTEGSIRAGIQSAVAGAVRELIRRAREAAPVPIAVVAAGTGAQGLREAVKEIEHVHEDAVLWGVFLAARAAGAGAP